MTTVAHLVAKLDVTARALGEVRREGPEHAAVDSGKSRDEIGKCVGGDGCCEAGARCFEEAPIRAKDVKHAAVRAAELNSKGLYASSVSPRTHR